MGIPKFFRYISERWPMISQLIDGTQIPEFDNLYLDMNSILHNCTHANDDDVTKRMTEEEVFSKIFAYIDHLFHTIGPKKTFYMAIDGVAPRAKMNQQRSRRFRTAMDAEKALQKAIANGEEIPKGEPFDSNCITPGTEFMAKLTQNLKYFIHDKVSNDSAWSSAKIILSGHEVPGEGEHKIMEQIRRLRSQPDYDPNTRHCIYGLDADLIMLGLSTHDPHFALLREEVTFGRRQKSQALEHQNFFLLHISLLREYLELEFNEVADDLQFEYDFERMLDDFILVMFVIGNDFLPNLPDLHLNKGAFPVLLQTFKEALKHTDGYINEQGTINLPRFQVWLQYLSEFELMNFERDDIDVEWFNKQLENISLEGERKRARMGKKLLLKQQKKIVGMLKPWLLKTASTHFDANTLSEDHVPTFSLDEEIIKENLPFLKELAFDLGLFVAHSQSKDNYYLQLDIDGINPQESEEEHESRIQSLRRSIKKYEQAVLIENSDELEEEQKLYNQRFEKWRDQYYKDKLGFSYYDEEELKQLTENYVEGLQWVLYYYYQGCQSWSWYYKYHYAPRISDVQKGLNQIIKFNAGKPFKPFQQLMAVLPERSKNLIPTVYRPLMFDPKSPIADFYPSEVELDKNGKTADWEAVVKLSFVDENRLIEAMSPLDDKLSPEEKKRNSFGTDLIFVYNPQVDGIYKSPLNGLFSDIEHNHCAEREYVPKSMEGLEVLFGLPSGAKLGTQALAGFPTLKTLSFKNHLEYNGCMVFQQPSRQQSMLLDIKDAYNESNLTLDEFAKTHLGNVVYSRWPNLRESKVLSVMDGQICFEISSDRMSKGGKAKIVQRNLEEAERKFFYSQKANMRRNYSVQKGVLLDDVRAIVRVVPVNGLTRTEDGAYIKTFSSNEEFYPLQVIVEDVENKDTRFMERPPLPIEEEFIEGSDVIFLGDYAYGGKATIDGYSSSTRLKLTVEKHTTKSEPTAGKMRAQLDEKMIRYYPSFVVSKKLQIHPLFLSRITSRFMVDGFGERPTNFGLEIKFESRHEKVLGYARRNMKGWEYSDMTIALLAEYKKNFPDFFYKMSTQAKETPSFEKMYPGSKREDLKAMVNSVRSWLKNVKQNFVTVSFESDSLTKASMAAVEEAIEKYVKTPSEVSKKQLAKVPREAVLDPQVSSSLLRTQKFALGDRVIYIQDSGKVPLFSKGTVVGYTTIGPKLSIQVLFDNEIVAGNNFGGRLRTKRGLGLDSSFLLNLTNRQFIYHSKASKTAKESTKKNQKPNKMVQGKPMTKNSSVDYKKKQAHELLTHIKKSESDSKEGKNVGKANGGNEESLEFVGNSGHPEPASQNDRAIASNIYNAVFNQFNGQPPLQPPKHIPHGLPYDLPPPGALPPHLVGNIPPPGFYPVPHQGGIPFVPPSASQYSQHHHSPVHASASEHIMAALNGNNVDHNGSISNGSVQNENVYEDEQMHQDNFRGQRGRGGFRGRGNGRGRGRGRGRGSFRGRGRGGAEV
ncbi:LANO_0F08086g1_1 [Lachancea nothofagi CBS 11611]|uniref:5'-3' exoribonuclease 1 n=1 Tax=Lachancea nothofagi CBS 11611 TaxID=1266666 RepID=A0A1G4K992_9SACH|nr:LANO_0F08086g1_1 [Lachancea nothofagi CBS 11611]